MNYLELNEGKVGCIVKECTNPRKKPHRFCNRCRDRRFHLLQPASYCYKQLRWSAKRRGIEFLLTIEEFKA